MSGLSDDLFSWEVMGIFAGLNPPRPQAVLRAMDLLMESIREENVGNELLYSADCLISSGDVGRELRQRARAVALAAVSLTTAASIQISSMNRRANAYALIHRLPVELLVNIFAHTLFSVPPESYFNRLYDLMRVCWLWAEIIRERPFLWSFVHASANWAVIQTALKRSQTAPLIVKFPYDLTYPSWIDRPECNEELCQHVCRWRKVDLYVTSWGGLLGESPWLQTPAPLLEVLKINVVRGGDTGRTQGSVDLFKGSAPKLRKLCLYGFSVSWTSTIFASLKLLELTDLHVGAPTLTDFLNILRQCSQTLVDLVLERVVFQHDDQHFSRLRTVELPNLTYLTFKSLDPEHTKLLFSSLHIPSCRLYRLYGEVDDMTNSHPLDGAQNEDTITTFKSILNTAERVLIHLNSESSVGIETKCEKNSAAPHLDLVIEDAGPMGVFVWLSALLDLPAVTAPITVKFYRGSYPQINQIGPVIGGIPGIRELNFKSVESNVILPVFALLGRSATHEDKITWPCPQLQTIVLRGCTYTPASLLSMLRNRYDPSNATVMSSPGPLPVELPVRLTSLQIKDRIVGGTLLEQVEEVVGPGVLSIDKNYLALADNQSESSYHASEDEDGWDSDDNDLN
ncbi:hypothetical protein FRB99_000984 [Tulasnella sp. 403]|nr:hypothetical protein FRB99_000984 [Tulasnella sp. 403]